MTALDLPLITGRGLVAERAGPQQLAEPAHGPHHVVGADRREHVERVLRAGQLEVEHRLAGHLPQPLDEQPRASSTGASVSLRPWMTKNGGASFTCAIGEASS